MKEIELSEFRILERLSDGKIKTYSNHRDIPIIFVGKSHCGFGLKAVNVLHLKKDDRTVFLEKNEVFYVANLPFDSKINGYKVNYASNSKLLISTCKAYERGLDIGYYKLLDPIYVSGLDLYELEEFDINQQTTTP